MAGAAAAASIPASGSASANSVGAKLSPPPSRQPSPRGNERGAAACEGSPARSRNAAGAPSVASAAGRAAAGAAGARAEEAPRAAPAPSPLAAAGPPPVKLLITPLYGDHAESETGTGSLADGPSASRDEAQLEDALSLAECWASSHRVEALSEKVVTYPNGMVVEFAELAALLGAPLPACADAHHRLRLAWSLRNGDLARQALRSFKDLSTAFGGGLTWANGGVLAFASAALSWQGLTPLLECQLLRARPLFDAGRNMPLDALDGLCMVDGILRVALGQETPAVLEPAVQSSAGLLGSASTLEGCEVAAGGCRWGARVEERGRPEARLGLPADVETWHPEETSRWVVEVLRMPKTLGVLLATEEIYGKVLLNLSENDLERMGVVPFGRRRQLLLGIRALRAAVGLPTVGPALPIAQHSGWAEDLEEDAAGPGSPCSWALGASARAAPAPGAHPAGGSMPAEQVMLGCFTPCPSSTAATTAAVVPPALSGASASSEPPAPPCSLGPCAAAPGPGGLRGAAVVPPANTAPGPAPALASAPSPPPPAAFGPMMAPASSLMAAAAAAASRRPDQPFDASARVTAPNFVAMEGRLRKPVTASASTLTPPPPLGGLPLAPECPRSLSPTLRYVRVSSPQQRVLPPQRVVPMKALGAPRSPLGPSRVKATYPHVLQQQRRVVLGHAVAYSPPPRLQSVPADQREVNSRLHAAVGPNLTIL